MAPELNGVAVADIEDRVTSPEGPDRQDLSGVPPWLWFMDGVNVDPDQIYVTETSALTYSAFWACVWLISQTIASLGWHSFQRLANGKGKEQLDPLTDDVAWIIDTQANEEMSAYDFRQVMMKDALTWGNGYAEIERDGFGRPVWVYRLAPDRVEPLRTESGRLVYEVTDEDGGNTNRLNPANVYHLKGPSPDGLVGYSIVAIARRSIELSMSVEQYGRTWARRGPMPGGCLEIPGVMKKEERDAMRESFQKTYGGAKNAGRVVVLTGGAKFNPLSLPNSDMQYLESRAFQIEDVCRWFFVPQTLINKLDRSTFNNIEALNSFFVQYCLLPWCRRLETEADIKLFGRVSRGRKYTKLNLNALLRGDSKTQVDNLTREVAGGLRKINEAREQLDMNPVPEGDTLLIQGAMMPVGRLLEEPEPEPPPAPPGQPPMPPEEMDPEEMDPDEMPPSEQEAAENMGRLLNDAFARLFRVEADKARRAANRGGLLAHVAAFYGPDNTRHVAAAIRPIVANGLMALHRPSNRAKGIASAAAAREHALSRELLASGPPDADLWLTRRPAEAVARVMKEIFNQGANP